MFPSTRSAAAVRRLACDATACHRASRRTITSVNRIVNVVRHVLRTLTSDMIADFDSQPRLADGRSMSSIFVNARDHEAHFHIVLKSGNLP